MDRARPHVLAAALLAALLAVVAIASADRSRPSPADGFRDTVVLRGLDEPLAVAFSPDGQLFVAEKGGAIKVARAGRSGSAQLFAHLGERVFVDGDRGLFGLALDPAFPERPYVYVLYTFDGPPDARKALGRRPCAGLFDGG